MSKQMHICSIDHSSDSRDVLPPDYVAPMLSDEVKALRARVKELESELAVPKDTNAISDGYHTFGELYEHRMQLYIALCRTLARLEVSRPLVWMSRLHSDGTAFDGWFVLGVNQWRGGQITYHLPDTRWDECSQFANVWDSAPEFDGHTSADVLERLKKL